MKRRTLLVLVVSLLLGLSASVYGSEKEGPTLEFLGVYLVANGRPIELKDRFLGIGKLELKTLSGIDVLDSNAYIIFYRDYPPTLYRKLALVKLRYNDKSRVWGPDKEIELKTAPLKDIPGAYRLVPVVALLPGVYSLLLVRSIGLISDLEMFDFAVNYQNSEEYLRIQAHKHYEHYELGMSYYKKGQNDDAIKEFKKVTKVQPNNVEAHFYLGHCYYHKRLYDQAIAEFKTVIQIQPNHYLAHLLLGGAYKLKNMYDSAIEELKKALEIKPIDIRIYSRLGYCYYRKKMYDKAITEYKKALSRLTYLYCQAIATDQKVPQDKDYSLATVYYYLACCYYEKKIYDQAIDEATSSLELLKTQKTSNRDLELLKTQESRRGSEQFQKEVEEFLQKIKAEKENRD